MQSNLPEYDVTKTKNAFISFCRLEPQKNLSMAIKAFAKFYKNHPEYEYHIFGNGELKEELEQQIQDSDLNGVVKIFPFKKNILQEAKNYRMFILSSDYEGLCMILVNKKTFIVKSIIKYGFLITSLLNILLIAGGTLGFLDYIMVNVLGESSDLDGRRQIWTMVLATFSRRPLMGYGMGSDIIFNVWQSNNASTHNYFLSILIYGGIVAIIVYLLLILLFYKKNKPYSDRRISQFLMLTLVIMNLEGIAENYGFNEMTVCFWVLIANIRCLYEWKSMMSGGNNETIGSHVRY